MKCTNCGCEELFPTNIIGGCILATEGEIHQTVKSYACSKCGHVELFVDGNELKRGQDELAREKQQKIDQQNYEKEVIEINKQIEVLESKCDDLKIIVKDENQTVKAVKNAQNELDNYKKEIRKLKNKIKDEGNKLKSDVKIESNCGSALGG